MRLLPFSMLCVLAWQALPVQAAEPDVKNRVVVIENVKLDYAQVLNVEPVYQTLRATRIEEQCEAEQAAAVAAAPVESGEGRINRMMDSVKEMFSRQPEPAAPAAVPPTSTRRNCKVVEVPREFRRPIAFDVDYVYKGTKYRSRLPEDPGNRLRIRVSVTPYIPDAIVAPPR
ncbi:MULTISPECIES: hypothetical protein [Xanthomonas]|uniref:Secreted protein n=1 Tax=Xanthomonas campestris pv. papavericola TaxID=487881 RepID=A0AAJ2X5W3_XANCA|nr:MULTISPECIES: hypothetical protein [Xanthomonas]KIQ21680.1 hypothetical protein RT95_21300 [Xanthomonas campestris]MCC5065991.1 hypothetical protein [Xanthomonas campestris pv. raphani]MCC5066911.1 hypothetical protein [Xanthomonas campestris]MCC5073171.1 hypothetical protein [Xanthomonas campestris pv. plantaginis]MCC5085565.1 hypothetical protein [Xanthomonas campestris]